MTWTVDRLRAPVTRGQGALAALLVLAGVLLVSATTGTVTGTLAPGWSGQDRALVAVAVMTGVAVAVRARYGPWRALGLTGPARWSRRGLLLLPLALAVSPLSSGLRHVSAAGWAVLLVGYTLTGFTEELVWRGFVPRLLRPLGPVGGALLGSALFGLAHLGNVLYRDSTGLVLAQAWGAFCFGVGYAALRRRVGSIVPLMGLHLLTDLCAAVAAGPAIPFLVGQDVVLLAAGLVLLAGDARRERVRRTTGGAGFWSRPAKPVSRTSARA